VKRLTDIALSLIALAVLAVPMLIIALWIMADDGLPVLFQQERVGQGGKVFKLFKFRSMYRETEGLGQITVGSRDPRITPSGYWIRKYKLDELPQLFNVLTGHMSLVGPRPEVPRYVALYTSEQRRVLEVKPGITDWASIKYRHENDLLAASADPETTYVNEIMPDKLRLNLAYVEQHGWFTDLKIMWLTLKAIVHGTA
jgi:lipopolysaccharide/colanic/teichoic acid biosynthesis glycosyltransferase